ncbi:MAG: hypothetical protein ACOY94_06045 [Bacillota bacterium]
MVLEELIGQLEALVRAKDFASALALCERALSEKLDKTAQARVLQFQARILVTQSGLWSGPAVACLEKAIDLTAGHPDEQGRVLNNCAAAYAALGTVSKCWEARAAFLEIYRQHKSPLLTRIYPSIEFNFALSCHIAELLVAAEEGYLLALAGYLGLNDPAVEPLITGLKLNLLDVYQETGQHEEANRLLQEVEKVGHEETFGAMIRLRRAFHALYKEDLSAALLHVESGLGHPSCDVQTRGALLLAKAKILKARGQVLQAHDYALEAMLVAANAYNSHLCSRVCKFLEALSRGES